MKKKFIALTGLFVLMVFVLAGCGHENEKQNQQENQTQTQEKESQKSEKKGNESNSVKGNFKELLGYGKKLKCEFSFENEETKMHGVAYTDGERVYQEVFVDQGDSGDDIKTSVITKKDQIYLWNSMKPEQGMKISLNEVKNNSEVTEEDEGSIENPSLSQSFDYKCEPWQVDDKKFKIPADKNFIDMDSFMNNPQINFDNDNQNNNNAQGSSTVPNPGDSEQACEACQYAPNPSECLTELGC